MVRSALALSNTSELEIKNLLKQVDTMIHHKKLRWERQKTDLDNKLHLKEQEYEAQRAELEQKSNEVFLAFLHLLILILSWIFNTNAIITFSKIKQLKDLLESMETTTQEIMKKYEKEISSLHQQVIIIIIIIIINFNRLLSKYFKIDLN